MLPNTFKHREEVFQVSLASAYRQNLETLRNGLATRLPGDDTVKQSIDLIDEAVLQLTIWITAQAMPLADEDEAA